MTNHQTFLKSSSYHNKQVVECENVGFDSEKSKYDWRCHAELEDRVIFNHVEVICEGYDYPEDDYILLGSCGLEFTLDYRDPHDYHDNSYYRHMDDHEREMHQDKVRTQTVAKQTPGYWSFIEQIVNGLTKYKFLVMAFVILALCSLLIVRVLAAGDDSNNRISGRKPISPRAVLATKKVC